MGTSPRTPLVAGNWKMNGTLAMARQLASAIANQAPEGVEVVLCPPTPYLLAVAPLLRYRRLGLGAQNLSERQDGAFTGEVSGTMLADVGCRYVLAGHSERRALYGESDELVAAKVDRALADGLVPILCLGETRAEREAGATEAVVAAQLDAVLARVGVTGLARAVVAYEPVWAIGTGLTAEPEQAQAVHAFIRDRVAGQDPAVAASLRILYGGSVKADNAASLLAQPDIDGGLIGGASLDATSFLAICQAASVQ